MDLGLARHLCINSVVTVSNATTCDALLRIGPLVAERPARDVPMSTNNAMVIFGRFYIRFYILHLKTHIP